MHNELFHIGRFTVYGYGLMIALGIIAAVFAADRRSKKYGIDNDTLWSLFVWLIIAGILGCKLLYIIVDIKNIIADPSILLDFANGFVIYGGIIAGIGAIYIFCRKKGLDFLTLLDLIMPSVALAQGIGRIGCFLAGCCYGKQCSPSWGIVFDSSVFAPNGVPLIPTQLIMSAGDLIIAAVLMLFARKNATAGKVSALYMILYGIGRFSVEFLRDDPRGSVGFLSTSQFISLFIVAAGLLLLLYLNKKISRKEETSDEDSDR